MDLGLETIHEGVSVICTPPLNVKIQQSEFGMCRPKGCGPDPTGPLESTNVRLEVSQRLWLLMLSGRKSSLTASGRESSTKFPLRS